MISKEFEYVLNEITNLEKEEAEKLLSQAIKRLDKDDKLQRLSNPTLFDKYRGVNRVIGSHTRDQYGSLNEDEFWALRPIMRKYVSQGKLEKGRYHILFGEEIEETEKPQHETPKQIGQTEEE